MHSHDILAERLFTELTKRSEKYIEEISRLDPASSDEAIAKEYRIIKVALMETNTIRKMLKEIHDKFDPQQPN